MPLVVIDHPLVENKISMLRDIDTGGKEFRELINEVAMLVCYEATRDAALIEKEITTPLGKATVPVLENPKYAVVPILRAGIGMTESMLALLPTARVGHIGLYRDPETLKPVEYYCKLPTDIKEREVLVIDPMIATGGSAIHAIDYLKERGVNNIKMLCIITCPEGVKAVHDAHPDVKMYTAAYDEGLNEDGYIIPGLGDAGDRLFGTK